MATIFSRKTSRDRSPLRFPPLRLPGQSLDDTIARQIEKFDHTLVVCLVLITLSIVTWANWWSPMPLHPYIPTIASLAAIVYAGYVGFRTVPALARLRRARDGERSVGQHLERLRSQGYEVFHDLVTSSFNIDHVIVGPAGIFTVETKTLSKFQRDRRKMYYNGQDLRIESGKPYRAPLDQAQNQARWLEQLINQNRSVPLRVRPILVFPGWWIERVEHADKSDVAVLNPKALQSYLHRQPCILSRDSTESISAIIRQYAQSADIASELNC